MHWNVSFHILFLSKRSQGYVKLQHLRQVWQPDKVSNFTAEDFFATSGFYFRCVSFANRSYSRFHNLIQISITYLHIDAYWCPNVQLFIVWICSYEKYRCCVIDNGRTSVFILWIRFGRPFCLCDHVCLCLAVCKHVRLCPAARMAYRIQAGINLKHLSFSDL